MPQQIPFSLRGRIKRGAEILPCLIKFCRRKLIWTPYHCQITTYYLVGHMRGMASELGPQQAFVGGLEAQKKCL